MNLRTFSQRAVSFIRTQYQRYTQHPDTSRFLKERNARLIIQMKESRSFSGQRLDVETQFNVGGDVFCIYSTLSTFRTLSVSVVDDHNQPVHQRKVPVNGEPLSLSLNLDRATLSIELDAAPTV